MDLIPIDKVLEMIGEDYVFDDMCDWSKLKDLQDVHRTCAHDDCKKAFWINLTKKQIRDKITWIKN